MNAIDLTILGRPSGEEIAAAARGARPAGWKLEGRFTITVRAYRVGPPDPMVVAAVSTALAGVLFARGSRLTTWTTTHEPDERGERLEVKVARTERPAGGQGAPTLALPGLETGLCSSSPPQAQEGAFLADRAGADWATDPYGAGEGARPGRSLRGGAAAVQRGRARTIAGQIAREKL